MTRFRDLLKAASDSTPGDEQERASKDLADAVAKSRLQWWKQREPSSCQGKCLLLGIAPFSQYDLILLDLIDESLASGPSPEAEVYVVNLQEYGSVEELGPDFPGISQVHQTPLVAIREPGSPTKTAWGRQARDLVAVTLGLSGEQLSARIMAETPSYGNPV